MFNGGENENCIDLFRIGFGNLPDVFAGLEGPEAVLVGELVDLVVEAGNGGSEPVAQTTLTLSLPSK